MSHLFGVHVLIGSVPALCSSLMLQSKGAEHQPMSQLSFLVQNLFASTGVHFAARHYPLL
jgi:hypothetical protein